MAKGFYFCAEVPYILIFDVHFFTGAPLARGIAFRRPTVLLFGESSLFVHHMRREFLITPFGVSLLFFFLMTADGCGNRSSKPSPSPDRDENGAITFVQWSDPHLFDGGAARRDEGIEEEKLDNWSALHWAVLQTNRLLTVDHRNIDFVVLTGDFGLYNVEMPETDNKRGGNNKKGPIERDGKCIRDPKEGPGPAIPFNEAVRLVAQEFRALLVKKIYLVPGNNDLCDEDPRNRYRYAAFVLALQRMMEAQQRERKDDLKAAKSAIETQYAKVQLPPVDPPTLPEIVDLTFTLKNLQGGQNDRKPPSHVPKAEEKSVQQSRSSIPQKCSDATGDFPLIKGFCVLGLDSSYFKAHDQKEVQDAADRASINAMDRLGDQVQRGGSYLLFTHVPDIEDPHPGRKSDPASTWLLPSNARDKWKNVLNRNELIAVFAGHFHSRDRKIYPHNFSYVKSLDPIVAQKFWLAPSLAAKYQIEPLEQETARGIVLFHVTHKTVATLTQPGESMVSGLPIWFSPLDPNPTLSLEFYRQLKLGEMYEQAGQRTEAESAYRKALDAATGEQRDVALRHLESAVNTWGVYELWMKYRLDLGILLLVVCVILVIWTFWRQKRRLQILPLDAPNDAKVPAGHLEQVAEYLVGIMRYREAKIGPIGDTKLPFIWPGFSKDLGTTLEELAPGKSSKIIKWLLGWLFRPEFTLRGTLAMGNPDSYIVLTLTRRGKPHTWEKSVPAGQAHDVLKDMVYLVLLHIKTRSG
jgi:hypothetical protein